MRFLRDPATVLHVRRTDGEADYVAITPRIYLRNDQ